MAADNNDLLALFRSEETRGFELGELRQIALFCGKCDDKAESFVINATKRGIFTTEVTSDSVVSTILYPIISFVLNSLQDHSLFRYRHL